MKLILIAFTRNGMELEKRLAAAAIRRGYETTAFVKSKYVNTADDGEVWQVEEKLSEWARKWIPQADGVIFIGAAGICVRTIAPFVKSKKTDPAVLVLDEKGSFVISLLSGHLGGANEMAQWIAEEIGAIPVITTATDVNHHFAVDVFAKKNHLAISNMVLAKEVSALVLQNTILPAGAGEGYVNKENQKEFQELSFAKETAPDGYRATFWIQLPDQSVLHLIPKVVTLGIGCKKGTSKEIIEEQVCRVLKSYGIFPQAIRQAASIDLKKDEPGLMAFCEKWRVPLVTYSKEELRQVEGNFTPSAFVSQITGVDNVCERSACLASGHGTLLVKKQAACGVTVACAVEDWSVDFE